MVFFSVLYSPMMLLFLILGTYRIQNSFHYNYVSLESFFSALSLEY